MEMSSKLCERISDFFLRQISFYELALSEMATIEEELQESDYTNIIEREHERVRVRLELEREFRALAKEWERTDDITDDEHLKVRNLARHAEELASELSRAYDAASRLADAGGTKVKIYLNEVTKGRELLGKYRAGDMEKATFLDRKI